MARIDSHSLTAFGPGKVILLGEHGVVYGYPALAGPLSIGVTASGVAARQPGLSIPAGVRGAGRKLLLDAFGAALRASGSPSVKVTLQSELPPSMGLGSSAAVSVACARLLLKAADPRKEPATKDVAKVAWEMERVFHGTPSGVDHTCASEASLIHFRRRPQSDRAQVTRLSCPRPLEIVVVLVGERPATKATVAALRARQAKWADRYARIFDEIGQLVGEARQAIEAGDLELLGDCMNMNQGLLAALGLSSESIESMVYSLRREGALGAKLTGAGGDGGAVIALFPEPRRAAARLARQGIRCFTSQLAGPVVDKR